MPSTITNPYSTDGASAPDGAAAPAPASAPTPPAALCPLGMSDKTNAGRGTAIRYINEWRQENDHGIGRLSHFIFVEPQQWQKLI